MPPILLDTNILVYASDPADGIRQELALRTLKLLETTRAGRLSVQCLAEFVRVTTRGQRPLYTLSEAAQQVESLMRAYPVFELTPLIVLEAVRGAREYGLAYYDAQIWATARLNQVAIVFSEDFSDGQALEGVRFINPFAERFHLEDWT